MNVRTFAAVCSVLVTLFPPPEARSDTVRMLDGTLFSGTILSSDSQGLVLRSAVGDLTLLQSMISMITFTTADRIVTTRADTIDCKIVGRRDTVYMVVTVNGPVNMNESSIGQIRFNAGGELNVTHLPRTDSFFRSSLIPPSPRTNHFFASFGVGLHGATQGYPLYGSTYLALPPNQPLSTNGFLYNFEFGWFVDGALSVGAGFESFHSGTIQIPTGFPGTMTYTLAFMTTRFSGALVAHSPIHAYCAGDLGFFTVGYVEPQSKVSGDHTYNGTITFRLRFGTSLEISELVSYAIEVRVLTGDTSSLGGIDFRGIGASTGLEFHFH